MNMELWAETTCELGHFVKSPLGIETLHGHSYWIKMYVKSDPEKTVSSVDLKAWLEKLISEIDHRVMNDKIPSGTMEELAVWIAKNMTLFVPTRIQIERKSLGIGVDYKL